MVPANLFSTSGDWRDDRSTGDHGKFEQFVADVRARTDAWLASWLASRVSEARNRGADVGAVADAIRQLVLRGGKRMRAVLLAAVYEGFGGEGGVETIVPAGAALELLQAYLLSHDDWMDGDDLRRGGPSVPAMMRARFGRPNPTAAGPDRADAAAILAGDLASAWALGSLLELKLAPARVVRAMQELGRVEADVVQGQVLDVCASEGDRGDVEAGYALKTGSYTVCGPILMGARLAGASEDDVAALTAFAEPAGIAFQLRDDVLGTFGDAKNTGKPSGGDLRKGKRTALVVDAMRDPRAAALLGPVLGRPDATEAATSEAVAYLESSGALSRVEERIATLVNQSLGELGRVRLTARGRSLLAQALVALTARDR
ncbi:MAG: polyprenyl synthetase family protein [Polyangiaceae bacterium]